MQSFTVWLDQYTDVLQQFIVSQVVLAPLLLLFVEEAGVPILIPGDVILAYTGYNISVTSGSSLWIAVFVALLAVAGGASILFYVAQHWGQIVVDKIGKFLFIRHTDIIRAETLFKRYGFWTILIGRHIPGMRIPLTIFAGISGMSYRLFMASTLASTILWIILFLNVGHRYGQRFSGILHHSTATSVAIIISIIVVFLGMHFFGEWRRHRRQHKDN